MAIYLSIIKLAATLFVAAIIPSYAIAHEYWLDPIVSSIKRGESVIVDVRNGQNFSGTAFPYDRNKFKSITISSIDKTIPYIGRLGDYPAIHPELVTNGIHTIHLESSASLLTYETWNKFDTFLNYHGLDKIRSLHAERKLPKSNIKERYFRSAKTVILVSDTGLTTTAEEQKKDIDEHHAFKSTGARFELILLDNPYGSVDSFRIKLLYKGKPLPERQVEFFWKGDPITRTTADTNEQGIVGFKMQGEGHYLLNAVQITNPESDDVHWESHWASITFER